MNDLTAKELSTAFKKEKLCKCGHSADDHEPLYTSSYSSMANKYQCSLCYRCYYYRPIGNIKFIAMVNKAQIREKKEEERERRRSNRLKG